MARLAAHVKEVSSIQSLKPSVVTGPLMLAYFM
jgi:hypothetical protein